MCKQLQDLKDLIIKTVGYAKLLGADSLCYYVHTAAAIELSTP